MVQCTRFCSPCKNVSCVWEWASLACSGFAAHWCWGYYHNHFSFCFGTKELTVHLVWPDFARCEPEGQIWGRLTSVPFFTVPQLSALLFSSTFFLIILPKIPQGIGVISLCCWSVLLAQRLLGWLLRLSGLLLLFFGYCTLLFSAVDFAFCESKKKRTLENNTKQMYVQYWALYNTIYRHILHLFSFCSIVVAYVEGMYLDFLLLFK